MKEVIWLKVNNYIETKEMLKIGINQSNSKVCIIGAGNGGLAAAADLTLRGNEVVLAELPKFEENIKEIKKKGGIFLKALKSTRLKEGFAKIDKVTTNIGEAISNSNIIFIITPSFAHKKIAEECAPYITSNHTVVLAPGNIGGSIEFYNTLIEHGTDKEVVISEMECMMYACRKQNNSTIYIRGLKHNLGFSTFPAVATEKELSKVKNIYPNITIRNNVFETGFSNINPILHVPILISNISNIENNKDLLMYHEGLTKSTGNISELMDQERMKLNEYSNAFKLKPMTNIYRDWYYHQGVRGDSLVELASKNPIYYESKLPDTLNHRYLLEDVPYGLIPMASILDKFNINSDMIKSVIQIAQSAINKDINEEARSLKTMKLINEKPEDIIDILEHGFEK